MVLTELRRKRYWLADMRLSPTSRCFRYRNRDAHFASPATQRRPIDLSPRLFCVARAGNFSGNLQGSSPGGWRTSAFTCDISDAVSVFAGLPPFRPALRIARTPVRLDALVNLHYSRSDLCPVLRRLAMDHRRFTIRD